ncbi:MAG TPA: hypothetical protein VFN61_00045 [Acidimicrobiales bacterium]|nr:hypothetical protein [Acidimicrobiales bacterium]
MPLGAFSRRRTGYPLDLSAEAGPSAPAASPLPPDLAVPDPDVPDPAVADPAVADPAVATSAVPGLALPEAGAQREPPAPGPGPADSGTRELAAGEGPEGGTVVLAIGRPYFHDGTVGEGRYESDLPPTLLAALHSLQELARAVLAQAGAPDEGELVVRSDGWALHLGPEPGHAKLVRLDGHDSGAPANAHTDRRAHQWLRGIAALRQSDHAQAQAAFEAEAKEAVESGLPQRAAVAYRAAAASARSVGRSDQANRMLRLAGKYYLEIAEGAETLPQGVFSAYREAARAFLEAGNLPLAHQSLTKAIAVGEALGLSERS